MRSVMTDLALPFTRPPAALLIEPIVRRALEEDLGRAGDITSDLILPPDKRTSAKIVTRKPGTVAGLIAAESAFGIVDSSIEFRCASQEGSQIQAGSVLAHLEGPARALLTAERVALNFVGHLSGIATATRALVDAVAGTKAKIVDTRKTTPGLRVLEKYAVRCGGGFNHRFGLDDAVLIKDNHIAAAGSLEKAVQLARAAAPHLAKIEVEAKTLAEVREALRAGAEVILLDNMLPDRLRAALELIGGTAVVEVSGGVRLETLREYALPGVDVISVGALTHSAPAADLSLTMTVVPRRRAAR